MPTITQETDQSGLTIYHIHLANGEYISRHEAFQMVVAAGGISGSRFEIKAYETPGFKSQVLITYMSHGHPMTKAVSGPSVWIGAIEPYTGPAGAFADFVDMTRQDDPDPEGGGGNIGAN